jgi:hypothetical protein
MTVALRNRNFRLRGCCKPWCEAWWIIPDRAWLIRSKGNVVSQRQALTLFRCDVGDHLVVVILLCEKMCVLITLVIERCGKYHVNLAEDALRMVSLEKLQDASLCWRNKRTIAHINVKRGDCWDIAIIGQQHVQPTLRREGCHYQW